MAAIYGGGGTVVYAGLIVGLLFFGDRFQSDTLMFGCMILSTPLMPGMVPGGLFGDWGFHGNSFLVGALISVPLVNTGLCYVWLKSREIRKSRT
jgi:hypothetical protein